MQTYFEIGGKLVSLENDFQELTGGRTKSEARTQRAAIREAVKLQRDLSPVVQNLLDEGYEVTWEDVGRLVGTGVGIAVAISTSPLTLVDGLLPIADAAWWAANMKFTYNSQATGARVGSYIDDHTSIRPGDFQRRSLDEALGSNGF